MLVLSDQLIKDFITEHVIVPLLTLFFVKPYLGNDAE